MSSSPSNETGKSPEPVDPVTFNLLKQMADSLAELTARMASMETRQPLATTIPLSSAYEQGGPSKDKQCDPLPDQRAAYEAAKKDHARTHAQKQPPPPRGVVPPHVHNYGYDVQNFQEYIPRPNSPFNRNAFTPNDFHRFQEEEEEFFEDDEAWAAQPP